MSNDTYFHVEKKSLESKCSYADFYFWQVVLPFYIRRGEQAVGAEDTQVYFVARQYTPGKSTVYGSQVERKRYQ